MADDKGNAGAPLWMVDEHDDEHEDDADASYADRQTDVANTDLLHAH
jgi:hypothetical protein